MSKHVEPRLLYAVQLHPKHDGSLLVDAERKPRLFRYRKDALPVRNELRVHFASVQVVAVRVTYEVAPTMKELKEKP